jgi:hypothetical protein
LVKVYLFVFHIYKYNSCVLLMQLFLLTSVLRSPYICCVLTFQCLAGSEMWELRNQNLKSKCSRSGQTRAFFLPVPHHPNQPCRCKRQTSYASMLDRVAAPLWGGVVCFSRGEAFSFLLFRFLLDLFLFSVFSFE